MSTGTTIRGLHADRTTHGTMLIWHDLARRFEAVERAAQRVRRYGEELTRYASSEETLSYISGSESNPPTAELATEIVRLKDVLTCVKSLLWGLGYVRDEIDTFIEECKLDALQQTRTIDLHVFTAALLTEEELAS